ncbi:MAG TPA: hypothetical protein VJ890_14205 [Vineibacter sp.]|nr:hypothetical protein [Vineibacter sp.]
MPDPSGRRTVRRIVTALPAAADVTSLVRLAAHVAGELDAQVAAVLVHNEALVRLASLPVTRHLIAATGTAESLTPQTLRLAMATSGQRLRESLDSILGAAHVHWTLHTLADEPEAMLPVALQAEDLLLISVEARIVEAWFSADLSSHPAVAAFAIAAQGNATRDVVAVHDGTDAGWRAIEDAILIARSQSGCCHVVIPALVPPEMRRRIEAALVDAGLPCRSSMVATGDLESLIPALRTSGAGILVLPTAILRQPGLVQMLYQLASEFRGT